MMTHLCTDCGFRCIPIVGRDNEGVGCLLTILFLLPGLLYYAFAPVKTRCPHCRSESVVPIGSPTARKYEEDHAKSS